MMFINRLFKGFAVVLTAIGAILIIWLVVNLVQSQLRTLSPRLEGGSLAIGLNLAFKYAQIQQNIKLVFIASGVEIALLWLLVLLDVISRRRGLIATLVLFIFVGIVVLIVYSQYPTILG